MLLLNTFVVHECSRPLKKLRLDYHEVGVRILGHWLLIKRFLLFYPDYPIRPAFPLSVTQRSVY
jgi:hypothetical protein